MTPRHDEIVKHLDDGFAVAWDTTKRDAAKTKDVRKVVEERSNQLGKILGTTAGPRRVDAGRAVAKTPASTAATPGSPRRRRGR